MHTCTSADGTSIAYEIRGCGTPLIVVGGATCDRALMRPTAQALGEAGHTVVNYDRRGRGDSGDTLPYAVGREVEDLAALIDAVGGAALYGHSSGAGLVLRAVSAGVPAQRFVLHDAPYSPEDANAKAAARAFAAELQALLDADRRADALAAFFRAVGMPDELLAEMRTWPRWPVLLKLAHTLAYDSAVMDDAATGGAIPLDLAADAAAPALVLAGERSPEFMHEVARALSERLPNSELRVIADSDHVVAPEVLAPLVAGFLRA